MFCETYHACYFWKFLQAPLKDLHNKILFAFSFSDCPAKFFLDVSMDENGDVIEALFYGCFRHENHEREKRFLRMSLKSKEKMVDYHRLGVPPEVIKQKHFALSDDNNNPDDQEEEKIDKPATMRDVKRICRKALPNPDTQNWPKAEAMMFLLEQDDVHLFNYGSVVENQEAFLNDNTRKKFCPTDRDRFIFFRMSTFGRRMFRENPYQIFVDGTFKCCNEELIRVNWMTLDRRGEGVIIATAVVTSERQDLLELCLQKMLELEPQVIILNKSKPLIGH